MNIQWTGRQIFYCISLVSVLCIAFYGYGKITFLKTFDQDRGTSYDCTKEMARLNADKVCQDDARLISAIKRCYMEPPSRLPYNLTNPKREDFSQAGQAKYVDSLLKHSVSLYILNKSTKIFKYARGDQKCRKCYTILLFTWLPLSLKEKKIF